MEKTVGNLKMGLAKLEVSCQQEDNLLRLNLGIERYTVVNLDSMSVVEFNDVQEWAESMNGIWYQLEKKLKEKGLF